jgi:hypothetical protein
MTPAEIDPYTLIGKQVQAADGGDYGHLIVDYDAGSGDFRVIPIVWSTGEPFYTGDVGTVPRVLDAWKASVRYQLDKAR